jgi:predicted permease
MNDALRSDVRYALRQFARTPLWTTVAVLSLTRGIAANLLIFSVVDAVLLRPLPYRDPDRLVFIWGTKDDTVRRGISGADLEDWRRQNHSFAQLDAFLEQMPFTVGDTGQSIIGACIGPSVLPMLGVVPALGRNFLPSDTRPGAPATAIVSDGFWRGRLGANAAAIGSTVVLNGRAHEIVGVTPPRFFFPDTSAQILISSPCGASNFSERGSPYAHAIGRLRDGVSIRQAEADLDAINATLARLYPETNKNVTAGLQPWRDILVGKYERALWVLLAAVGVVLLIACANVAHLQLARGLDRQVELAIRASAGAPRARLFRQLVTESLLLASAAGVCALFSAWAGLRVVRSLALTDIARIDTAAIDWRLAAFAASLSLIAVLVSGAWPAWTSARVDVAEVLKLGGGTVRDSGRRQWSDLLAVTELALATALLIVAGLLIGSFVRLSRAQWGFDPAGLMLVTLRAPAGAAASNPAVSERIESVRRRVRALPGVATVASAHGVPIHFAWKPSQLVIEGEPIVPARSAAGWVVSHGYFKTIGTPLLEGREFAQGDDESGEPVIVVSRALAQRLWPRESAIGRRIQLVDLRTVNGKLSPDIEARARRRDPSLRSDPAAREVVGGRSWRVIGIVEDIRAFGLHLVPDPAYYLEFRQAPARWVSNRALQYLVVRVHGDSPQPVDALKAAIQGVDAGVQIRNIESMSDLVAQSIGGRGSTRLMMVVSALFGSLTLLLTASGIFAVVLHTVNRRLPEIAVRMALGASRRDIAALVLRYGIRITVFGVSLGLTLAWAASRSVQSLVFEVKPTDASTWAAGVGILVIAVLAACIVPIRRATRYDAAALLRA